ncbi:hypothetical protein QUF70_04695 [Desulfobacterales bacterium HSG17]|nr:hypothetical protein [Desulfobacterales bacterium HSG17]
MYAISDQLLKHKEAIEKRTDCPLVTLALMLDSSGFGNLGKNNYLADSKFRPSDFMESVRIWL